MEKKPKLNPSGAPVLACEHDHECTMLTCDFCLKDLPSSDAICEEGRDYVAHFCGLNCLEAWRDRHAHDKRLEQQ